MAKRCVECGGRYDRPGLFGCTEGHPVATPAQRIIREIEADLCSRRGCNSFGSIDDDVLDEIRDSWERIVLRVLSGA